MDRTVLYRELVRIALDGEPEPAVETAPEPDAFTKEINKVATTLRRLQVSLQQIRPRYLAVSGLQQMQDAERDDFDYRVRGILQEEQRRVRALEKREQMRFEQSQPRGIKAWLGNPETEGVSETLAKHRQGMCFYLNSQLQKVSSALGELQQVRIARMAPVRIGRPREAAGPIERDIGDSNRPKQTVNESSNIDSNIDSNIGLNAGPNSALGSALGSAQGSALDTNARSINNLPQPGEDRTPEEESQMQLLLEEHDALLEDLNATYEKAQRAEQSLREVAELQAELSQHLSTQTQQLDSLTDDAMRTSKDISAANEQLERSKRSNRRASRIIIVSSLATGVFLLLLNGR